MNSLKDLERFDPIMVIDWRGFERVEMEPDDSGKWVKLEDVKKLLALLAQPVEQRTFNP